MATEGTENGQEGTENTDIIATEANASASAASEENQAGSGEGSPASAQEAVVTPTEPDDESIKKYFASKGRVIENVDDLFVEKEKIVEVNPYENVSDDLKQILAYSKETGRGVKDYFKLQENIDEKPLVEVALAKAGLESGGEFSTEDLTAYLEDHLSIDLSGELTAAEKVKLTKYVKDYKENFKAEQEKYKTPLPKAPVAEAAPAVEMIELANGQKVEKSVYEAHEKAHQAYQNDIKVAVDSVAGTSLQIEFDNNGTKEILTYGYEFDENDKQSMLALSQDVDQTVGKLFRTEKGFDHQAFAKALWRLDPKNWEKEVGAIVNKARAEAITELTKADNNVNFQTNGLPAQPGNPNVKYVPVKELLNR